MASHTPADSDPHPSLQQRHSTTTAATTPIDDQNHHNARQTQDSHLPTHVFHTEKPLQKSHHGIDVDGDGGLHVDRVHRMWDRFRGKGRKKVSWITSMRNLMFSSYINVLIVFIPLAWIGHFLKWSPGLVFAFCFLSIMPLEHIFDYGGEQMSMYCGRDLGDLVAVTLNNAVEATLAILLLTKCELKLLQSTIVGVVLLHLLLVPGTAFLTGGARIWEQNLHPHPTQLNHTLLTIGVLTLLIPAAFFAALDRGAAAAVQSTAESIINDTTREHFLRMSRGLAVILLCVYIASRIFLHNPPGDDNAFRPAPDAPEEIRLHEEHLATADPELDPFFCVAMLIVTIGIMAATAEWLVDSIEFVREKGGIQEEWFGLILLPIVSFSADGAVAIVFFIRAALFLAPKPPATLAKARAIDLSIQFTLFWMPFLVLLSWWIEKPLTLLFDFYEVAVLLGACFLVNYVTADSKTNWVEGFVMVSLYIMIALCTWFYTGQEEIATLLGCPSVTLGEAAGAAGGGGE
ncbi:hypothetical protein BD410DRAFT_790844 [Rickenella mellea]|uniref:Sodium/calcium exchanger membrane region domain-containing protein n=1 Tax=Rickenella mellea TaxID=50990 RepID=A0A4Y7PY90_9AGAM|nr:hypothetical protein BD410DRAFT_790844 [Rickenella mellea]